MRAELLKMRCLLTPRIMLALALAIPAVAALITYLVEPDDIGVYHQAPLLAAQIGVEIAAIVVGVWIVAMEFSQGRCGVSSPPSRAARTWSRTSSRRPR
jgi:hypothetical protein